MNNQYSSRNQEYNIVIVPIIKQLSFKLLKA